MQVILVPLVLILGLLNVVVPVAWALSMMALPVGLLLMIFGGGGAVFANAAIVAIVTTVLLWIARRVSDRG